MPRVRRLLPIALAALVAAGCGGKKAASTAATTPTTPPATTTPVDPGATAAAAFITAARAQEPAVLWRLLSTESKERLGGSLAKFKKGMATALTRQAGSFRTYKVIVSERVTPEFGVVGFDGKLTGNVKGVGALVLRLEGSRWKVELDSPVHVKLIGPAPDAPRQIASQVAAAVSGPGGSGTAVIYVDGEPVLNPKVAGTATSSTLIANFDPPLAAGRHTVVVFASDGREAGATAWAFDSLGS
jgi:hypothetical protein